ncbi:MAG: radical SAM protein, partial [Actinomycetia bacterium]|nr:radical SAM protein [Actinomycetes bacterium]
LIENLDEIPSPYLTGILTPRDNVSYIATYRGCPYKCAYCFEGKNYPKLRFFSEERTDAEIKLIMNDENVKSFSIIDPVFNLNKLKTEKLTKILSERNIGNTKLHTIEIITEHIDQETVTLFKKANIESVETGPQTVNEDTLKNVNRYFEKEKFGAGIKILQKNGINVICDLIIGLPGDNFIKFLNSIKYIYSLRPNRVVFSTLHVLPGTQLFNESDRFGLEFDEKPPHYVISAKTFSFADIRKAEIMSKSLEKEYSLSF